MAKKTMADVDVAGKTVVMRVDFNVPLLGGQIESDRRIVQALPTIADALGRGARLVLMSHLGQPEDGFEEGLSLKIVAERFGKLLKKPVPLGPRSVVGPELDRMVAAMKPGDALLMENLRFHRGETMPDKAKTNPGKKMTADQQKIHDELVSGIAKHGDIYVNDAFGTCHREHASMFGLPMAMQGRGCPAVAGYLVEKEIRHLGPLLATPDKPYVAVLGGGKIVDKLKLK